MKDELALYLLATIGFGGYIYFLLFIQKGF